MYALTFVRQVGISYAHQVKDRLSARVSYMEWFNIQNIGTGSRIDGYINPRKKSMDIRLGDIQSRGAYRSIDLAVVYQLLQVKKHELYVGGGISYTWGWYSAYTRADYDRLSPHEGVFELAYRKHRDLGLLTEVGYNYMIGKKSRINIGLSETVRVYTTMPFVLYTNLNIGYNFNWKAQKNAAAKQR